MNSVTDGQTDRQSKADDIIMPTANAVQYNRLKKQFLLTIFQCLQHEDAHCSLSVSLPDLANKDVLNYHSP